MAGIAAARTRRDVVGDVALVTAACKKAFNALQRAARSLGATRSARIGTAV